METFRIVEFLDVRGRSPFRRWFDALDPAVAARVATALYRLGHGHASGLKSLGGGLLEWRLNAGPGYRVYLGRVDATTLLLLGAGTKATQHRDIATCRARLSARNPTLEP